MVGVREREMGSQKSRFTNRWDAVQAIGAKASWRMPEKDGLGVSWCK